MAKTDTQKHNITNENLEIIESLSANERKILPYINKSFIEIINETTMDEVAILRALEYLSNKKILELSITQTKIIELGVNGVIYKQKGLPERRLINLVASKKEISLEHAKKESELSENEFQASLGALKKKALINLANGKLIFNGTKEEIARKTLEEQLIAKLPMELDKLAPEEKYSFEQLKNRKEIVQITNKNQVNIKVTEFGNKIIKESSSLKMEAKDFIEAVTAEVIASGEWKNKKFRRYDLTSPVPKISGGKRHFVNQSTDYARKIWTELGFKEMTGNMVQTSFWNFDALFTAQDHPVREMQDTFYIKDIVGKLPNDKALIAKVKEAHEKGVAGSKGWGGEWKEENAKKILLRTHTTALSSNTLAMLGKLKDIKDKKGKFFAVGKCFRNETIDWSHGFEFNQTEGIVIDKDANFRNLLGYVKEFFKKMGFEDIKFVPSYFPYTEPSVEIYAYNSIKKVWIEVGGAGIFRPEVTIPLLGEYIPILAWGPGFDRTLTEYYGIKDLRELYENDLTKLREMKFWMR
jgi:phenylalanyl-tRNA synthetase alpha chain